MKRLVISLKTAEEVLRNFKEAYHNAKTRKIKEPHYEISFDNRKDFDLFTRNIHILSKVLAFKPKSIYELAKITKRDLKSVNTDVTVLHDLGLLSLVTTTDERKKTRPEVKFDKLNVEIVI